MNSEKLNIFILAGGFGTRLKSVVSDVPKPMAPILNKPFLDYQIKEIRKYFPHNKIYLLTHYLSDVIENYYKDNELIVILKEDEPLGTGGSITNAIKHLKLDIKDSLLILNGDTYIKPKLNEMISSSEEVVIVASFQKDCERYGTLKIEGDKLVDFLEKKVGQTNSYINAGCYYFKNISFFKNIRENKFAVEDKFKQYLFNDRIGIFKYNDVFIDIGIPDDYIKMINYIKEVDNASR